MARRIGFGPFLQAKNLFMIKAKILNSFQNKTQDDIG